MGRRKSIGKRPAAFLRQGILDGRLDAALWGKPTGDGNEAPKWSKSFYWKGVGGEPDWLCGLYDLAYRRSFQSARQDIWKQLSATQREEAKAISMRNQILRTETTDARAIRLFRESLIQRVPELS